MRALLYRRGGLGDTLLTFPLLELLRRKGYEVTAVGNTDYFRIALEVGWADRVLSEIPEEDFDLRLHIGVEGNIEPFPPGREWVVSHYLRSAGLEGSFSKTLPLKPLEGSPLRGKVVFHPSSGSRRKNPELSLFLKLEEFIRSKGYEVVYIAGEADGWLEGRVPKLIRSLDPLWIGRAIKGALLYVGLDSGISHLASYVGTPSVIIYGPSDPVVWKPVGSKVHQVSLGLECAPCFPNVCEERTCLREDLLLERLLPLLDHLLVEINEKDPL